MSEPKGFELDSGQAGVGKPIGKVKRIIRRQIATGRFNDESEVIRHSPRLADSLERAAGPLGCSFAGREDLEGLLLEGLDSGESKPMTPARKKQIYKQALENN